jgi:ankyrin repeat protein
VAILLIKHKADLKASSKDQRTLLYIASEYNHIYITILLLEYSGHIKAKLDDQGTPLYAAYQRGHKNTT